MLRLSLTYRAVEIPIGLFKEWRSEGFNPWGLGHHWSEDIDPSLYG